MNNHIKDILVKLSAGGVKFVVCGGVAVVLHGIERLTNQLLAIAGEKNES